MTSLHDFVVWNAREENKYYRYDYFADNCSTRLRDALDRALGGALRRATDTVTTAFTYRRESVRLTDGDAPVQLGIDIALGRPADVMLTAWESYFIPMRLRDGVRDVVVEGASLVAQEQTLPPLPGESSVAELRASPRLALKYGMIGVFLAAAVAALRIAMMKRRGAAWAWAVFGSIWSLVCGVLGSILLIAWFATKHVFWRWNETDLLLSPLSLVLVVLIPLAVLRGRRERGARMWAAVVAVLGVVALLLAIIPGGQENRAIVALVLPVHLALAWALALPRDALAS